MERLTIPYKTTECYGDVINTHYLKTDKKVDELTNWIEHKFKKYVYKYTNATYYLINGLSIHIDNLEYDVF